MIEKVQHRFTHLFKDLQNMYYLQCVDCLGLWSPRKDEIDQT